MQPETIDLGQFIDERKIGRYQWMVVALCAITVFLDGYDTQSVAFVAPSIMAEWHLTKTELGSLFTSSLVGLMIGSLGFGVLADRVGRRPMVIACTAILGLFTLCSAFAGGFTELLVLRFLTGLGLGGVMPNAIALTAEYCPARRRATLIMLMFAGLSLGAVTAGLVSAALIPHLGWRSVWIIGGVLPLLLAIVQLFLLPESIQHLLVTRAPRDRIVKLLSRIDPGAVTSPAAIFAIGQQPDGAPVRQLFAEGRATGTLLLWAMFFGDLLVLYFLLNWIPIITHEAGVPAQTALLIGLAFQVGGTIACVLIGWPIDRFGAFRVLPLVYACGFVLMIVMGQVGTVIPLLFGLSFFTGFFVIGGQNGANAAAALYYPTAIRSTGVGWALGIGRIGAIIGPMLGGLLLAQQWSLGPLFLAGAIPLVLATLASLAMNLQIARSPKEIQSTPEFVSSVK